MLNKALLSLGNVFENFYTVVLTKTAIDINHNNSNILPLEGHWYTTNGMWKIEIYYQGLRIPSKDTHAKSNNVY